MKLAIFGGLSALALFTAVSPVAAVTMVTTTTPIVRARTEQTTPFELVNLAERGYLRNQGIPRYANFIHEIEAGSITPKSLVKAAIQNKLVTPETLSDRSYLNAVHAGLIDAISID